MINDTSKEFIRRHIGPSDEDIKEMLKLVGANSLDDLMKKTVPDDILLKEKLKIGEPTSEHESLKQLKTIGEKNKVYSNFIGMGYYGTYTPLTGEITETNPSVVDDPAAVNKDPEGNAWFFKIKIKNKSELENLMSKADYDNFAKENPN